MPGGTDSGAPNAWKHGTLSRDVLALARLLFFRKFTGFLAEGEVLAANSLLLQVIDFIESQFY